MLNEISFIKPHQVNKIVVSRGWKLTTTFLPKVEEKRNIFGLIVRHASEPMIKCTYYTAQTIEEIIKAFNTESPISVKYDDENKTFIVLPHVTVYYQHLDRGEYIKEYFETFDVAKSIATGLADKFNLSCIFPE